MLSDQRQSHQQRSLRSLPIKMAEVPGPGPEAAGEILVFFSAHSALGRAYDKCKQKAIGPSWQARCMVCLVTCSI